MPDKKDIRPPTGNPSGNSKDRKRITKAQQRIAENVLQQINKVPAEIGESKSEIKTARKRLSDFWSSTPVWGAIGVLIGAVGSQLSLRLLFFGVWAVLLMEFIRIGLFRKSWSKIIGSLIFGCLLAVGFIALWKVTPKPKEPTTLDQQIEAFAKKFPWLSRNPDDGRHKIDADNLKSADKSLKPQTPQAENVKIRAGVISLIRELEGLLNEWEHNDHGLQAYLVDTPPSTAEIPIPKLSRETVQSQRRSNNDTMTGRYRKNYYSKILSARDILLGRIQTVPQPPFRSGTVDTDYEDDIPEGFSPLLKVLAQIRDLRVLLNQFETENGFPISQPETKWK